MFFNLDKFQSFSAAGVQAELKKTVEEAYATIKQIKEKITPFIWSSITNLTYNNRFEGMPINEEEKYTKQLESLISSQEINDPEVSKAIEKYNRFRTWEYFGHFKHQLLKEKTINWIEN